MPTRELDLGIDPSARVRAQPPDAGYYCYRCSRYLTEAGAVDVNYPLDADTYCSECAGIALGPCEQCEGLASSLQYTPNGELCVPCIRASDFARCWECCDYENPTDLYTSSAGNDVCGDCIYRYYSQCEECEEYVHDSSMEGDLCYSCDEEPDVYDEDVCDCPACRADRGEDDDSGRIHGYGYKPEPQFYGEGPLYLGIELEIETGSNLRDCVQLATETMGSVAYLKEDGSICRGFEMVTHPMSYTYAMESFPWSLLSHLEAEGAYVEPENNGMHIHVSRDAFESPAHVYRWLKLLYRNEDWVSELAGRTSDQWAAFRQNERKGHKSYAKGERFYSDERGFRFYAARYSAVNVLNDATFELRFFASTLDQEQARACVAFTHATVEYARAISAADICQRGAWSWFAFSTWVREQGTYPDLEKKLFSDAD